MKPQHNFNELSNGYAQQQLACFIVAICCKSEMQSEILHNCFYQRLTLNTKKSGICRCNFKQRKTYSFKIDSKREMHKTADTFLVLGLILIFSGIHFFLKSNPYPYLKFFRIRLETSNLVRKYIHICSFRKYIFQCQVFPNFAIVSIFWQQNQNFFGKNIILNQWCESYLRGFVVPFQFL